MKYRFFVCLLSLVMLAGCASVTTKPAPVSAGSVDRGLVYYLPMRDFKVVVSVNEKGVLSSPTVTSTDAYADLRSRFVLEYGANLVGTNKLTINVNERGLLTSAISENTSQLSAAIQNVATSIGMNSPAFGAAIEEPTPNSDCKPGQTYSVLVRASAAPPLSPICGFQVTLQRLFEPTKTDVDNEPTPPPRGAGIAYRQTLPYVLSITEKDSERRQEFLVFSPSEAPTSFLPVQRSLFASTSQTTMTFSEGMPTSYEQKQDGELVSLFKLPADVIQAYFTAIGTMFTTRKTVAANEKDYLKSVQDLALQQLKLKECQVALASQDKEQIKVACTL